jgi:hypothetical protein
MSQKKGPAAPADRGGAYDRLVAALGEVEAQGRDDALRVGERQYVRHLDASGSMPTRVVGGESGRAARGLTGRCVGDPKRPRWLREFDRGRTLGSSIE